VEREVGSYQQYLPDVRTSSSTYVQFEGYVKSNGAHHHIISGDVHYSVKDEFYNGNGGFVFEFYGELKYPLKIKWRVYHYCEKTMIFTVQID